ncbi:MAG: NUDIX hydrolase [Deltaproteobacteria bacterium]|nr:NUDIX hydrolase [Deltaproteobacteria bacterium]
MSEQNPWKTLSSRKIYENPWIRVREDQVLRPDGSPGIYGVIEAKVATGVVALTEKREVYLVGQYRYPTKHYSWEIIEGGAEPNEAPLQAVKRELREEAGLEAGSWEALGSEVHLSNCFSAEVAYLYIARDLKVVPKQPDVTEVLDVRCVPFADALKMVDSGEIKDAMSIMALLRTARALHL